MTTRVGILLVHGIQQEGFDPLEDMVHKIAEALETDKPLKVAINIQNDNARYAEQKAGYADYQAPFTVTAEEFPFWLICLFRLAVKSRSYSLMRYVSSKVGCSQSQENVTELHFSAVRWADLDKFPNLKTKLSFWVRVLSIWTNRGVSFTERVRLFCTSLIIVLIVPLLFLFSWIVRQFLGYTPIRSDIVFPYIGGMKLLQPRRSIYHQLPLVTRRERMVKSLVNMSLRDYDRWYILSHGQGTVVAFNSLMETEQALPNYLDQDLWKKWSSQSTQTKAKAPLTEEQVKKMVPSRPDWLNYSDIISREELFAKLKGFMTYGSPLSYFAILWSELVPLNRDESVFNKDFEWLNIYDPSDPVATRQKYFRSYILLGPKPQDIAYKAASFHLFSRSTYFNFNPKRNDRLVNQVASWLLKGEKFERPASGSPGWPNRVLTMLYSMLGASVWGALALIIAFCLSYLVPVILPDSLNRGVLSSPFLYIGLSAVIVLIVGIVRIWLFDINDELKGLLIPDNEGIQIIKMPSPIQELNEVDWELQEARQQLSKLLPPQEALFGIHLNYRIADATTLSGDYLNYIKRENKSFGIYVVDVEGHGLVASNQVRSLYQLLTDREVDGQKWGMGNPKRELERVDKWVRDSKFFQQEETVFCMNFTEIDLSQMKLRYANAGMPPPLLFRPGGKKKCEIIEASGLYIGKGYSDSDIIKPTEKEVSIEKGDLLVIYSDGITEAQHNRGKLFGRKGIIEVVSRNLNQSTKKIVEEIILAVKKHSRRDKPEDDQALVVVSIGE